MLYSIKKEYLQEPDNEKWFVKNEEDEDLR